MGSWSVHCGISNIAITSGQDCILLPIKKNNGSEIKKWMPATLPIFGKYNDYGGIEDIIENDNTKLIEEYFGVTIEEFCVYLVDGKNTYNRDDAKEVAAKLKNTGQAEQINFMWIDKQVFDFMSISLDDYHKGYMDYGRPEMLKLLGFEQVINPIEVSNYDTKRFNQVWRKGDLEIFSDGKTILTKDNRYVYHYGHNNETSIETYFDIPVELEHLKDIPAVNAWRYFDKLYVNKEFFNYIIGSGSWMDDSYLYYKILGQEIKQEKLYHKYFENLDLFGDSLAQLYNIQINLHPMSGQFHPHELYLTPQCGEYETHQKILEKFAEINKSFICDEE